MNAKPIARMTWEAFRDAVDNDTVAVIPMGSVELEGSHLPLGVDTIAVEALARSLVELPGVLVGPTLPIGYSKWFMPFPGTITLETDTLIRVLLEYARSLIAHGIRRLVFLNAHKGNNACIESAARTLIAEDRVQVAMLSVWKLAHDLAAVGEKSVAEGRFTHAGEIMTSVMLAADPDTVDRARMAPGTVRSPEGSAFRVVNSLGEADFMGSVQTIYQDIRQVTDSGILGDPTAASAEKGAAILETIARYATAFIAELQKLPLEPAEQERP